MYKSLMPDLLSIQATLPDAIGMASSHGFAGVDAGPGLLTAPQFDVEAAQDGFRRSGVRPGYVMMSPIRVPVPEAEWRAALADLPLIARRAQQLGYTRACLVVLPFHETLSYNEAFAEHVRRLNEMTAILDDHGIALGLEYVSPLTRRAPYPYAFVYDMAGMLELCASLASPNAGLLLDSFHWYCAQETSQDIKNLRAKQIVAVHVNDAPPIPRELQNVSTRALPGASGVINIQGFMNALEAIGYDGPVTCEPMASAIEALGTRSNDAILKQVSTSLDSIISHVV